MYVIYLYDPFRKVPGNNFTIFQAGDFNSPETPGIPTETSGAARKPTTQYNFLF